MTASLPIGQSYDDLKRFLREIAADLGMTNAMLDEISGVQSGYAGKLLAPNSTKNLGPMSFGAILGALGLKFQLVVDEEARARIISRFDRSVKSRRVPMDAQPLRIDITSEIAKQILSDFARENGRASARARMEKLTPEQRSRYARKAAKARWKRPRNKPSMGTF
jgi:hypothetical protein